MKTRLLESTCALALSVGAFFSVKGAPFTYQGVLSDSGRPAQSAYDLRFRIYGAEAGGIALAEPVYADDLIIQSGHFVAMLEFGEGVFNGDRRWLEIAVRSADSLADYTILNPRQLITAAPYAITAANATHAYGMSLNNVGPSNSLTAPLRLNGDASEFAEFRVESGKVAFIADNTSDDHHGTPLLLQASNGMGPDKNGGNILLLPGFATGQGRAGRVVVDGDMKITGSLAATALFADGSGIRNLAASNLIGVLGNQQLGGNYANPMEFTSPANQFRGTFHGDGGALSNLTAVAFAGTLPNSALSGTYADVVNLPNLQNTFHGTFVGDGAGLSNIAASRLVGALPSEQLAGAYSNAVRFSDIANQFAGVFQGDGTALSLSASRLTGTVPPGALSGTYGMALNLTNPANAIHGSFTGNGSGLSNVNASSLEGFASGDFARRSASNHFSAPQTFTAPVSVENDLQVIGALTAATLSGDGSRVRNVAVSNLVGVLGNAQLQGPYVNPIQFTSAANQFSGNGAGLTGLNAAALTGLVPNTALGGTYGNALNLPNTGNTIQGSFTGDGSRLTNFAASNIVGVLASARLQGAYSNSLQLINSANHFNGTFTGNGSGLSNLAASTLTGALPNGNLIGAYGNALILNNSSNRLHGSFVGDASGLTNIATANFVGLLSSAQLSGTYANAVQLTSAANQFRGTFTGDGGSLSNIPAAILTGTLPNSVLSGIYNNALTLANPANTVHGSFNGNGSALNNLNASALSTGTVPDARLSANVAMLNGSPLFSGSVTARDDLLASRLSVGSAGINTTNPVGRALVVNGAAGITVTNTLEFGASAPGKHVNAGKIGYQTFTPGALDIVGAGTNLGSRRIKFWAESGATFHGSGTNALVILTNTVDDPTSIALATPFSTWRLGQNKPPDEPNAFDSFFIYQQTSGRTRLLITDTGRVGIGTNNPGHPLHLASGAHCTAAGVWNSVSDRDAKEDFRAIQRREVLAKVVALPITRWRYKSEPESVQHLGPTAQDFHATFGLGESDRAIGAVDADGVALAAIQGLNDVIKEKEAEIHALKTKNHEIEQRLKKVEELLERIPLAERK